MKLSIAPLALLLIGAAAIPGRPSFSCKGNLSAAERAICADPELAAWDQAMAKVYRLIDKSDTWQAERHATWLAQRNRCGSKRTCLLGAYRKWPGFSMVVSGVGLSMHRQGTDPAEPADLEVMHIYGAWHYFAVDALFIRDAANGNVNTGTVSGVFALRGDKAGFDERPGQPYVCRFTITRNDPRHWTINQSAPESQCGGMGVNLSGDYRTG
jgi:hypothetical protein